MVLGRVMLSLQWETAAAWLPTGSLGLRPPKQEAGDKDEVSNSGFVQVPKVSREKQAQLRPEPGGRQAEQRRAEARRQGWPCRAEGNLERNGQYGPHMM